MAKEGRMKKEKVKTPPVVKRPPKTRSVKLEAVVPEDRPTAFGPK